MRNALRPIRANEAHLTHAGVIDETLTLSAICASCVTERGYDSGQEDYSGWENDIRAFEKAAAERPDPENAVVFVGRSSITLWSSLRDDMSPFPVIQRGFGGSTLGAVAHYAERLVNVSKPRAVVVFAGSNDITPQRVIAPEELLRIYRKRGTYRSPDCSSSKIRMPAWPPHGHRKKRAFGRPIHRGYANARGAGGCAFQKPRTCSARNAGRSSGKNSFAPGTSITSVAPGIVSFSQYAHFLSKNTSSVPQTTSVGACSSRNFGVASNRS